MTGRVALLVMTDGRQGLVDRAVQSARHNLPGIAEWWMHDDSGDPMHRLGLSAMFHAFTQIGYGPRRGFGGAIVSAWRWLAAESAAEYVFHLEDDFVFRRPVELAAMVETLDARPHLAQLALRRQPWNDAERAAGGVVEQHPDDYVECSGPTGMWLEHRRFFTTNPSLYRMSLARHCSWPPGAHSEGHFGISLLERGTPEVPGPDVRFAFWGGRDSGEAVEHIGHERVGRGY